MSRIPVFATGLVLGAGVSAAAVYLVYNSSFSGNVKTAKHAQNVTVAAPVPASEASDENENSQVEQNEKAPGQVSFHHVDTEEDYYPNIDGNSELYDSLIGAHKDQPYAVELIGNNEIVKKEKMIGLAKVKVVNKAGEKSRDKVDTLLNEANNIKDDQPSKQFDIEFWQTPLNSRGYRMGKGKIALYGMDPESPIALFQLEEGLFLRSGNTVYRLESSPEFKSLRSVNEKNILKLTEN